MKKGPLIIAAIIAIIILTIISVFVTIHNDAVIYEERVNSAASDVEVVEKRRIDLIQNLVDCVKDYNSYESETMKEIIAARISASNADAAELAINAVAEAYPELKSSENYQSLMTELSLTENQIANQRKAYNDAVKYYNQMFRKFPNNIVLKIMGMEKIDATYTEYNAPEDAPQNLFD